MVFGCTIAGYTTHLVGGELTYECIGGDQYKVTLKIYRDCGPDNTSGTPFDQHAVVGVYDANGGLVLNTPLPFPGSSRVSITTSNPCLQSPPDVCLEEAVYTGIFDLPPIIGGYYLVYQRCCRSPVVQNITSPEDWGSTLTARIPGPNEGTCNNSAVFTHHPPFVLCVNEAFHFDYSASDPDADSLVYRFCTPYHGGDNSGNAMPDTPASPDINPNNLPPYYQTVHWEPGFSATHPLPADPLMSIDPNTGEITGTPTQQGLFAFAVCVQEYRNGVFLNETRRDFQFKVTACLSNVVANIPGQTSTGTAAAFCSGTTVHLRNSSVNASSYFWDFGDPNTSSDTSGAFEPVYTFTDSGTYTITLIVNPGYSCADTAYSVYELYYPVDCNFPKVPGQCMEENLFSLQAEGTFGLNAVYNWNFGALATPQNSPVINPEVTFSDTGHYLVSLTITESGCTDTHEDTIVVYPSPEASFHIPDFEGCVPFGISFSDSSFAWTDIDYLWDFGDNTTSDLQNPYHIYDRPGTYEIHLQIETDSGCIRTANSKPAQVWVHPLPTAHFWADPTENSILTPVVNVINDASDHTGFLFLMGDNSTYAFDRFEHSYPDTGHYNITQIVWNEWGCTDTAVAIVYIWPELLFYAPNAFTPDGDGLNDLWHLKVSGAKEYKLMVYNRWGEVIWSTNDPLEQWDGVSRRNNTMARNDTYGWVMYLKDINTRSIYRKEGRVTLLR